MQKERSNLDHKSLLSTIRNVFTKVPDSVPCYRGKYSITDCLMSAVAMFSLKYPSLLQFDGAVHGDEIMESNLKALYQIAHIPSDSQFRARLDDIAPNKLDTVLDALIVPLQRGKILDGYKFLDDYYLVSIDGTGLFSSDSINCVNCCVKHGRPKCLIAVSWANDALRYTHELLQWKSKISKGNKGGLLLLYSPGEQSWHLHEYNSNADNKFIQRRVNAVVATLLSRITSNKISKDFINEVSSVLLEDESLFDGVNQHGYTSYYHQTLSAVMMHPDKKEVFPLAIEPMVRQDGLSKNDCERNAAVRLLKKLKSSHPHLKLVIVLDALYANGPLIKLLQELNFRYIITAKNTDFLFAQHIKNQAQVKVKRNHGNVEESYFYSLNLPLNGTHQDIRVNLMEYTEVTTKLNKKKDLPEELNFYSAWLSDLPLDNNNLRNFMKGARSRWKIENETYNTLKNQGYHFEHNYGHGNNNLCTVLCYTMFIAFLIDQIQFSIGYYFRKLRELLKSKISLWEHIRVYFFTFSFEAWDSLYQEILDRVERKLENRFSSRLRVNTT